MDRISEHLKFRPFFDTFRGESDRACAVLAGAFLDSLLERLLRRTIVQNAPSDLFQAQGPLATFSAKIDMAYSLGLIPKDEHGDFHGIRRIRNDFAHAVDHELSFSTHSVASRIQSLRLPMFLIEYNYLADKPVSKAELQEMREMPRKRFEVAVGMLTARLHDHMDKGTTPAELEGLTDMAAKLRKPPA
jgi:DNA-binding MltR family transcriptional regulator